MPQIRLERVSKYYPQDKKQMAAVQEINLNSSFSQAAAAREKVRCSSSYPGIFALPPGPSFWMIST